ncbi:MAG TPA: inorganic diphosphatase [Actinomycetota bacterium]|nr:inorganic diphosphatase [Actinomycetota bacterium]
MTDPTLVEVFVEIPKGSRNKYEYDHERGVMRLDRRLFSATTYPADYGFIPETLAEDKDPLDALVLCDDPTFPGCLVRARPLGIFWMQDEKGNDAKILCVPAGDPVWEPYRTLDDLTPALVAEIEHFFDVYKMLEPEKSSSTLGTGSLEDALKEIEDCRKRYAQKPG